MLHIFFNLPTLANDTALYIKKVVFLFHFFFFDRILKNQLHRQSR